MYTKNEA